MVLHIFRRDFQIRPLEVLTQGSCGHRFRHTTPEFSDDVHMLEPCHGDYKLLSSHTTLT